MAGSRRTVYVLISFAAVAAVALTVSVNRLESRPPSVERATLWIDSVRLGPMVRQIHAAGTFVPEHVLLISALTPGRVDSLPLHAGAVVASSTILMALTNPDVQLQYLEDERQLAGAKAAFVSLQTALEQQRLSQSENVAQAETDSSDAARNAAVLNALDRKGMAGANEVQRSRELAHAAQTRLQVERERSRVLAASIDQQLALQHDQLDRLTAIADFQQHTLESLHVTAGQGGVLEAVPVQLGQWVTPGTVLARIARPGKLKAVLRVPESEIKDVATGQTVSLTVPTGNVSGRITAIDTGAVDVALDGPLPKTVRADQAVDATIEIERLPNVLSIHRPANGQPESTITLFKLLPDGHTAVRTAVTFGRSSATTVEVLRGLEAGDKVILSDVSSFGSVSTLHID
jgi:HlyD family secretion protein